MFLFIDLLIYSLISAISRENYIITCYTANNFKEMAMTTALNTVKKVYDRFSKGDLDGVVELCSESIEWVVNGPSDLKKCRAFKGHNGVRQFFDILESIWEFNPFNPQQFVSQDNTVIVLGEETGKDKNTGKEFTNRWAHVFDVQDNKIVRFREFFCYWIGDDKPPSMSWGAV